MFERLYRSPAALARHTNAPYAKERIRYLSSCAARGYSHATLLFKARELLWVARKLAVYPSLHVTLEQIKAVARGWAERQRSCGQTLNTSWTRTRFIQVASAWLRSLGYLRRPGVSPPFADRLDEFAGWMEDERGLAATTIQSRCGYIRQFLFWYGSQGRPFSEIQLQDVDAFLASGSSKGWSRRSVNNVARALRPFFRYAATRNWCRAGLADVIHGPRVYSQDVLPVGPTWPDVRRLLAHMETDDPADVRDRALVMLFAVYGLRASEVAHLRLEDLDWEHDLIRVTRVKRRGLQTYPLLSTVGNAIVRYIRAVRPSCAHREVFLTLLPPFRPLSRGALYSVTSRRLTALDIQSPRRGPHALRHACAGRLAAEGFSLKEIGDHLGHRSTSATRIYSKVDLPRLREVAAFDLGELP